jgi:hypothetical protein
MVEWRTRWRTSAPKARPTRPAMTYRAPVRALRHNENRCSVMSYDNLQTVLVIQSKVLCFGVKRYAAVAQW